MTDAALAAAFFSRGWAGFPHDPEIAAWASAARPVAGDLLADPELRARWLRCGGTWFAGVNVFPNDDRGAVPDAGVPPVSGAVVDFVRVRLGLAAFAWDRAQISICLPGYPAAPSEDESEAAFRFRRDRDAAHVDGLARDAARRRTLGEVHGFILGIPLTQAPRDAAPLVVWEGSHEIIRSALKARLAGVPVERWALEDITDAYAAARGQVFETCRRVVVHALPGECYLVHRLALHGVAPWGDAEPSGSRAIAYFRPDPYPGRDPAWWLDDK